MCRLQKYSLLLEIALMLLYSLLDKAYITLMLTFTICDSTCWKLCFDQNKTKIAYMLATIPIFWVVNIKKWRCVYRFSDPSSKKKVNWWCPSSLTCHYRHCQQQDFWSFFIGRVRCSPLFSCHFILPALWLTYIGSGGGPYLKKKPNLVKIVADEFMSSIAHSGQFIRENVWLNIFLARSNTSEKSS